MAEEKFSAKQIKHTILNLKNQIPKEEHEIAGIKVWVFGLTSYELEDWRLMRNSPEADSRLSMAKLVQLAVRYEDGTQIFQANEIAILAGLPARDIEPISKVAMRLSGYGIEAEELILKNLLKIPGGDGLSEQHENINAASPSSSDDTPDGK